MVSHSIKKNLRLLAERYGYVTCYEKDNLLLKKDDFIIKISSLVKGFINVRYSNKNTSNEIDAASKLIYHIVLRLFDCDKENLIVEWKSQRLLNLELYYEVENFSEKEIRLQINELLENGKEYKEFGGNLIFGEYYKGVIILTDDLYFYSWNVVDWM